MAFGLENGCVLFVFCYFEFGIDNMTLPKPYYTDPDADIKIYNADCLELMKEFPDKSFDLIVTSPPYNMGGVSLGYQPNSTVGQKLYGDYEDKLPTLEYQQFLFNIIGTSLLKSRYVFWNMQMVASTKDVILNMMQQYRENLKDIFIWHKQAVAQICVKHSPRLASGFEFIFLFGNDNTKIFKYSNFPSNGYVPNIQTWYKKGKESRDEHHATFPESLPKYFIQYFTKPNDLILDPFLGSGTTLVACKELHRRGVGIEISEKYCEIAVRRLKNTIVPMF